MATSSKGTQGAPAVAALTNLARIEGGAEGKPAQEALGRVLAGREQAIVKLSLNGNPVCNGLVVDGRRGWVAAPRYCLHEGEGAASRASIEFSDGSKTPVARMAESQNGLLAFLNVGKQGLPDLSLSSVQPHIGGTIIQIGFDIAMDRLRVVLGRVIEVGPMTFRGAGGQTRTDAPGLRVALSADERSMAGTGGAPLFDNEGNVACMTFQSDRNRNEECLAAEAIAIAMKQLPP